MSYTTIFTGISSFAIGYGFGFSHNIKTTLMDSTLTIGSIRFKSLREIARDANDPNTKIDYTEEVQISIPKFMIKT
jgi:hypothetical protein